jgi:hypothetical protein
MRGKAQRSGECGEAFCKKHFGIEEDDTYEIKSCAYRNYQFVVRVIQMMKFYDKQFVVVRYKRRFKTLSRGPRKGKRIPIDTIEEAYRRHLDIYALSGMKILEILCANHVRLQKTNFRNDGPWAPYWPVLIRWLPTTVLHKDRRCTVYGDPLNPPPFLQEEEAPF